MLHCHHTHRDNVLSGDSRWLPPLYDMNNVRRESTPEIRPPQVPGIPSLVIHSFGFSTTHSLTILENRFSWGGGGGRGSGGERIKFLTPGVNNFIRHFVFS